MSTLITIALSAAAGGAAVYFWMRKRMSAPVAVSGPTEKPQDTGGGPGPSKPV